MKTLTPIIPLLLLVILNACGSSKGNFYKQKYTNLKPIKVEKSPVKNVEDEEFAQSNQSVIPSFSKETTTLTNADKGIDNSLIQFQHQDFDYVVESTTETEGETHNKLYENESVQDKEVQPILKRRQFKTVKEKESPKKTKRIGNTLLASSLLLLFGSIIVGIGIGGMETLLFLFILLGIFLLIVSLFYCLYEAKQEKKPMWLIARNRGFTWLTIAVLAAGLGILISLMLWADVFYVVGFIVGLIFLSISIFNFVKAFKNRPSKNG